MTSRRSYRPSARMARVCVWRSVERVSSNSIRTSSWSLARSMSRAGACRPSGRSIRPSSAARMACCASAGDTAPRVACRAAAGRGRHLRSCQRADEKHGRRARPHHYLRPEYSSICVVRSIGYEIRTSAIDPSSAFFASSFGCTNPV